MRLVFFAAACAIVTACGFSLGSEDLGEDDIDSPRGARSSDDDDDTGSPETTEPTPPDGETTPSTPADAGVPDTGPKGPLKAFVSSTLTTGSMGGLTGADALCNNAAKAAGLPGSYTAWLSTTAVNASDRIQADGPWQLVNGTEIAKTKADLVKGSLAQRFDKDEKGNTPPPAEDRVWTATGPNGNFSAGDCNEWLGTGGQGLVGEAEQTDGDWTALTNEACTEVNRVYCLQQ